MKADTTTRLILIALTVGVWVIALQNFGVISPIDEPEVVVQDVRSGEVEVDGGYVDVGGSVDVNLEAINGHRDVFFNNTTRGEEDKYYRLPVVTR